MIRIWIVQAQFMGGSWDAATFTKHPYCARNFYEAHKFKRAIQKNAYTKGTKYWTEDKFRVVEYIPKHF